MKGMLLAIGLVFFGFTSARCQVSADYWHEGFVVTIDHDTLNGTIKYDLETNMVQINVQNQIRAFSSYKVFYFELFDEVYKNYRQFYTIPYKLKANYSAPVIFELLYEGGLSLLSREKIVQVSPTSNPIYYSSRGMYSPSFTQTLVEYDYYFLDKKGLIMYFDGSRNDLLRIMSKKKEEVKSFMQKNRLKPSDMKDLIRIASFYNSI